MPRFAPLALAAALLAAYPAAAEIGLSIYGGAQDAPSSTAKGDLPDGTPFRFEAEWEGRSFTTPPYYGLRATWWRDKHWGASIDFTHAKIHATEATRVASGFSRLSFTHGLNTLAASVLRRFPTGARATPYLGAGLGIAIPHAEINPPGDFPETLEYQFGGLAVQARAGVGYALTERWSVFGEAMATHVRLRADMEGGGDFATNVTTSPLIFRVGAPPSCANLLFTVRSRSNHKRQISAGDMHMTSFDPVWPRKTRELHNHHFDSTIWSDLVFRPDDIVIATYAKSGTTWVQQIVGQLLFGGDESVDVPTVSPWLDLRVPPKEIKLPEVEAQTHRRFLKTHLPVDALTFSPQAKYIYIARDGRDVVWSLHNHHANANEAWYAALNDTPGRVGPAIEPPSGSVRDYFLEWLERDGHPFWSYWENIRTWWEVRTLPNVLLVHFADLKADMPAEIRRIAR